MKRLLSGVLLFFTASTIGCASQQFEVLNPFGEDGPKNVKGERSSAALMRELDGGESGGGAERARKALETIRDYRRAQPPQPTYPVIQPAEVRLMWIPDHLNRSGDLVPAHYYYLKVLPDRWAVQDAFELEQQLNQSTSSGAGGATPWKRGDNENSQKGLQDANWFGGNRNTFDSADRLLDPGIPGARDNCRTLPSGHQDDAARAGLQSAVVVSATTTGSGACRQSHATALTSVLV